MTPTATSGRGILVPVSSSAYPIGVQGYLHIPYTLPKRMLASGAKANEIALGCQIRPRVACSHRKKEGNCMFDMDIPIWTFRRLIVDCYDVRLSLT
jgi:hypothetical protein